MNCLVCGTHGAQYCAAGDYFCDETCASAPLTERELELLKGATT